MALSHIVIMGVAGCGKSTIAKLLAQRLEWPMADGDDFHPVGNIEKMRSGAPLSDRWPWLDAIREWTARQDADGHSTVVACSALTRAYRDRLRCTPGRSLFIHLVGTPQLLTERISGRSHHFMPPALLLSQLAALESLEPDLSCTVEAGFSAL